MIHSIKAFVVIGLSALSALSGLTGCRQSPKPEPAIQTSPPAHGKIQSTVFPPESDMPAESTSDQVQPSSHRPAPDPDPAPSSGGIHLLMEGNEVTLEELDPVSMPGEKTVMIRVDPATPYREVVSVMEQLHNLGYLLQFQSGK